MNKFYFGSALSAHQSEGNNFSSDWWEFENTILKDMGLEKSGKASNHWELFEEDFKIARELGHNAHRFSIEWAKVEPSQGQINYDVLEHYKKVLDSLLENNITPFITLFHFTLPKWFADIGGFEKKGNIRHFLNYCKLIGSTFRDEMKYIITMNEPNIYAYHGYLVKKWPPQQRSYFKYSRIVSNLVLSHKLAYEDLKGINPEFKIGIAKNNQVFRPDRKFNLLDHILSITFNKKWNHEFLDRIKHHQDFIGLNYYFYRCVRADFKFVDTFCQISYPTSRKTDMNWEVYPKGLYILSKDLHKRYKKPIIITENGVADHSDKLREDVIKESLYWLFKAREEKADIFGYLHWALIDNYEWDSGFTPRFGLIKVDYDDNFNRTIRPSALTYREQIKKYKKDIEKN